MNRNKWKIPVLILGCIVGIVILINVNIKEFLKQYPKMVLLKANLDFLETLLTSYTILIIIAIILLCWIALHRKFDINITKISVKGIDFNFKNNEETAKFKIKNYLNSKRSLFVIYEEYDNYYDVINTYYNAIVFLRSILEQFEKNQSINNPTYQNTLGIIIKLNGFLTKYQSDYRRWYENNLNKKYRPFISIQKDFYNYDAMTHDLNQLVQDLHEEAKFFDINISQWKNIQ